MARRSGTPPLGSTNRARSGSRRLRDLVTNCIRMRTRVRISKSGQISIPPRIRQRWGTSTVTLEDQGERIVLEPAPDDLIAAAEGALAGELGEVEIARLRRQAREDERIAEARRRTRW